jgi:hypothetical protein
MVRRQDQSRAEVLAVGAPALKPEVAEPLDERRRPPPLSACFDETYFRGGFSAHIVIVDFAKLRAHAAVGDPLVYARDAWNSFVNGVMVLDDGQTTGTLPGMRLLGGNSGRGLAT